MNHEKHERHEKILMAEECYRIQGAIYDVYRELGSGFLETVYQECLEREFVLSVIPFEAQKELPIYFRGARINQHFRADFICFDGIIIEIKAVREIAPEHKAQVCLELPQGNRPSSRPACEFRITPQGNDPTPRALKN
jgi:GxxExxY protein